ncbi:hypothetical protein BDV18DRAFT_162450 [Aspergillus unguis]
MLYLIILIAILTLAAGLDGDDNYFSNPSLGSGFSREWQLGDDQVIAWETTLERFNISIWQLNTEYLTMSTQGNVYSKIYAEDQIANFTWTVQLYGFDLDDSNIFVFWLDSDDAHRFSSGFFNITKPDPTSEDTTNTTDTTTSSSSPTPSASSASSPADTGTSTSPPQTTAAAQDSGLPTTAKVALGVGLGIGLPILATLAVLIWQRSRAQATSGSVKDSNDPDSDSGSGPAELAGNPMRSASSRMPKEVPGTDPSLIYPELPERSNL